MLPFLPPAFALAITVCPPAATPNKAAQCTDIQKGQYPTSESCVAAGNATDKVPNQVGFTCWQVPAAPPSGK